MCYIKPFHNIFTTESCSQTRLHSTRINITCERFCLCRQTTSMDVPTLFKNISSIVPKFGTDSHEGRLWYGFYVVGIVVVLFGCLGNTLIIIFFACKQHKFEKVSNNNSSKKKSSQDIWFILLATTELITCLNVAAVGILAMIIARFSTSIKYILTQFYLHELSLILMSWTLVGIAVDKYYIIACPLRRRMTVWNILIAYLLTLLCICGLAFFVVSLNSNISILGTRLLFTFFESILPSFIMVTLWLLLSRKLRESSRSLALSLSDSVAKQVFLRNQRVVQVIKILIVLFGVFVTLPLLLKTSVVLFHMTDYEIYARTLEKISFLLNHTNSTVNVIVYAGRLKKFRMFLRSVFCRFWK